MPLTIDLKVLIPGACEKVGYHGLCIFGLCLCFWENKRRPNILLMGSPYLLVFVEITIIIRGCCTNNNLYSVRFCCLAFPGGVLGAG